MSVFWKRLPIHPSKKLKTILMVTYVAALVSLSQDWTNNSFLGSFYSIYSWSTHKLFKELQFKSKAATSDNINCVQPCLIVCLTWMFFLAMNSNWHISQINAFFLHKKRTVFCPHCEGGPAFIFCTLPSSWSCSLGWLYNDWMYRAVFCWHQEGLLCIKIMLF